MRVVNFKTATGKKLYTALLPDNFTRLDLIQAVPTLGDLTEYRLLIKDQALYLDDDAIFNRQKHLIDDFTDIILLNPASRGTFIEISLLKEIILEDLKNEWKKIDLSLKTCDICMCLEMCATIHHTYICLDCFPNYLKETNFELRCTRQIIDRDDRYRFSHRASSDNDLVVCKPRSPSELNPQAQKPGKMKYQIVKFCEATTDYRVFFKTPEFIDRWSILCDVTDLLKNIDCQICHCGTVLINMTLSAKQQCSNCYRWLCFFCNRTWNDETMKNHQYTCTDDCEYQRRLEYELVPLYNDPEIMVPDRRCCPKCFIVGGYANACKYHSCPYCRYQFCFICLKTDENCKSRNGDDPYGPCTAVKKQDYSIFPCIDDT